MKTMTTHHQAHQTTGWVGWVYFSGFVMTVIGAMQAIIGLAALFNGPVVADLNGTFIVANIAAWGWIHLIYGLVVLAAGIALFQGKTWARVVGVLLAVGNILVQFAFVSVYPLWAVIIIAFNLMLIYAITVHGSEARLEE